jgi:hypothetical protein
MDDLFSDLSDDEYLDETSPMNDLPDTSEMRELPDTRPLTVGDDEFDMLRQKTVRTESTYSGMDTSDYDDSSSGFSLSNFTTSQRLILVALLLLDVAAVGFGFLVLFGRI